MNKFKILMVTSEAVPFAKTGGLADVVSALSAELRKQGHDVKILMPRYYNIDRSSLSSIESPLGIPMAYGDEWTKVYHTTLPETDVPVYFLDHENLYGRDGIYGPTPDSEFSDNSVRYSVLSKASFQFCKMMEWYPDVMHCHDWPTALVPALLYNSDVSPEFHKTASVLTIHNLGYQGWFPYDDIDLAGLDRNLNSSPDSILNLLRTGIMKADILTTVSPTYSWEIQTENYGYYLDYVLRQRKHDLFGILNGCDYTYWDPSSDPHIMPHNYDVNNMEGKQYLKRRLQEKSGFPVDPDIPVIGMVTRLVDQKGIGPLCGPGHGSLFNLCHNLDVQVVIVGTGDSWCESELRELDRKLPNFHFFNEFNNKLAHLVEAGSDFFLMPSKYEPCGLNQMYSLRYGTLPIVRNTGGLADTVETYNEETGEGTGFIFNDLTPEAIYNTTAWAVWAWYNKKEHIEKMQEKAMEKRFSWEDSAEKYSEVYQWAHDRKTGVFPRSW